MVARAQGRDFSSYGDPITADDLKNLDFVFFRATNGDGSLTTAPGQGGPVKNGVDTHFAHNWAVAKRAGIPRGAYHFLHSDQSAGKQAQLFVDTVRAQGLAVGDMLVNDVEQRTPAVSDAALDDAALAFCQHTQRLAGQQHPILVYANQDFGKHLRKTAAMYRHLWIAHPDIEPDTDFVAPFPRWVFWQHKLGAVDKNVFNGDKAKLKAWIAPFLIPPKAPEPWNEDHLRHLWHVVHTGAADANQRQLQTRWMDYFAALDLKPNPDAHERSVLTFARNVLHVALT